MANDSTSALRLVTTAVTSALGGLITGGATILAELVGRIVSGIKWMVPAALALGGCHSDPVDAAVQPPKVVAPVVEPAPVDEPKELGAFKMTFYYMVGEDEIAAKAEARAAKQARAAAAANDNQPADLDAADPVGELASIVVPELVNVYQGGGSCEPITQVSREFAAQLALQGTGKLKDGRVLNVSGHCNCERSPCFKVVSAKWGTAGNGRMLQPFRTVAVDPRVIKLGSLLHIPPLEGRMMPGRAPWGGFIHDGCVVADDTGGGIKGKQLDLFVGRRAYYHGMSDRPGNHSWARKVPVYDGSKICERKGRQVARKSGAI